MRATQPIAADYDAQAPVVPIAAADLGDETHSVASRGWSIAPLIVAHDDYWYNAPDDPIFERRTEFDYDGLGNVLVERDLGAPDDDVRRPDDDDHVLEVHRRRPTPSTGAARRRRRGSRSGRRVCASTGRATRRRSPSKASTATPACLSCCASGSPRCRCATTAPPPCYEELVSVAGGTPTYATTNMTLNQYGDYTLVMAPPGADGVRYTVRYTYDADRHSNVSEVEEFDVDSADAADVLANGPNAGNSTAGISSSATFDPLSGRVASRTDANGATRSHVYDEHGRIVETTTMATPATRRRA